MKYVTASAEKWNLLKPLARSNRLNLTECEKKIWNIVRRNQLGVKFRRQHAIAGFIVDFVALEIGLVIEIDGEIHNYQKEYDGYRTEVLNELGYKVIRFKNEEIIRNIDKVRNLIRQEIEIGIQKGKNSSTHFEE